MSYRFDAPLVSGAYVFGNSGLGVRGSAIPSTGDNGAAYAYNDLSLPADANKEVIGEISRWPSNGQLVAYEDTSFEYIGDSDSFDYVLKIDGVIIGSATVTLSVGSNPVTINCAIGTADATGLAAAISQAVNLVCSLGQASAYGNSAVVQQGSGTFISCQVGHADASGYQAVITGVINTIIQCSLGTANARGYTASISGEFVRAPDGSLNYVIEPKSSRPANFYNTVRFANTGGTRH